MSVVTAMLRIVEGALEDRCQVPRGSSLAVACSGGLDSMVLLDLLARLAPAYPLTLSVITIDHGLRPGSAEDADLVQRACEELQVPVARVVVAVDPAQVRVSGLEAAARLARHRALRDEAHGRGAAAVALAHHQEDQAETVLMRALVGTGIRGLAAMRPRSDGLVRPLLTVPREQLRAYAEEVGLAWRDDPSNLDPRFLRNRLRQRILPIIREEVGASAPAQLARLAERCATDERLLTRLAAEAAAEARRPDGDLSIDVLRRTDPALQVRILADLLRAVAHGTPDGGTAFGRVHLEAGLRLLAGPDRRAGVDLPGGLRLERRGDSLFACARDAQAPAPDSRSVDLSMDGPTVWLDAGLRLVASIHGDRAAVGRGPGAGTNRVWFDLDRLTTPLYVQTFAHGSRIRPFGGKGSRKVSDVLGEAGIPHGLREVWPMVTDGKTVVWVPGGRAADVARVNEETRRILELMVEQSR